MCKQTGSYEHILYASLSLFLQSLQLVAEAGQHTLANPASRHGLAQAIEVMHICGTTLQRLPPPPAGEELADRQIRAFGREVSRYAADFRALALGRDGAEVFRVAVDFARRSQELKQAFREAAAMLKFTSQLP